MSIAPWPRPNKRGFFGIELPDRHVSLCVGKLPFRKRWALYFEAPGSAQALAYFNTEDDARRCISFMLDLSNRRGALRPGEEP